MDLTTVESYRRALTRADLALAPGERILAGGTWWYSEANRDITGLVDLTTMGWEPITASNAGLEIAATCTIARIVALPQRPGWSAQPLFAQCANALLASFKIWNEATVGGNICRAYAAGAMIAATVTLDATATIWTPDGGQRRTPVASLVAGNGVSTLGAGEVLRSVLVPASALTSRTAIRKIALAEHGRSGAVLTGRVDTDGAATFVVTAATERPRVLRYDNMPTAATLDADAAALDGYYSDAFGAADWRRHVSRTLLAEVRDELAPAGVTR